MADEVLPTNRKACAVSVEKFAVVEFEDSLAGVVPTSWIFKKNGKIRCKWTASKSKTVACELPNPSWDTYSINRVVAYRASYDEADDVCKQFEEDSTVEVVESELSFPDTDPAMQDGTGNSRDRRGKKRPLNETELSEGPNVTEHFAEEDPVESVNSPVAPSRNSNDATLEQTPCRPMPLSHDKLYGGHARKKRGSSTSPVLTTVSGQSGGSESGDSPDDSSRVGTTPKQTPHRPMPINNEDLYGQSGDSEYGDSPGGSSHVSTTPKQTPRRPVPVDNEDLYDILTKLLQIGEENKRLNLENKRSIDRMKLEILQTAPGEAEEVVECFDRKLSTVVELNEFDKKLEDPVFKRKVVSYLATYSGADPLKMVLAMMTATIEHSLAAQFSFAGKSKNGVSKLPFRDLKLNKCIYYAVKRRFQSTPDLREITKNGVESWLRSSPMRTKREMQKKEAVNDTDTDEDL